MELTMFLAGVGGQGMQSVGKSFIKAADAVGLNITYSPLYTFEKRGGLSSCYVNVSDKRIGSPRKEKFDLVMAMDNVTAAQFGFMTKHGGALVLNSTLVTEIPEISSDVKIHTQPFLDMALELGSEKVISSLALGYIAQLSGLFSDINIVLETGMSSLKKKPALWEINEKAFRLGVSAAKKESL